MRDGPAAPARDEGRPGALRTAVAWRWPTSCSTPPAAGDLARSAQLPSLACCAAASSQVDGVLQPERPVSPDGSEETTHRTVRRLKLPASSNPQLPVVARVDQAQGLAAFICPRLVLVGPVAQILNHKKSYHRSPSYGNPWRSPNSPAVGRSGCNEPRHHRPISNVRPSHPRCAWPRTQEPPAQQSEVRRPPPISRFTECRRPPWVVTTAHHWFDRPPLQSSTTTQAGGLSSTWWSKSLFHTNCARPNRLRACLVGRSGTSAVAHSDREQLLARYLRPARAGAAQRRQLGELLPLGGTGAAGPPRRCAPQRRPVPLAMRRSRIPPPAADDRCSPRCTSARCSLPWGCSRCWPDRDGSQPWRSMIGISPFPGLILVIHTPARLGRPDRYGPVPRPAR